MSLRVKKFHPALKHGAYSATGLLPGEDPAAFEKLYGNLIAEYAPDGVSEHQIVENMARYIWRMQNLETFRVAARAYQQYQTIESRHFLKDGLVLDRMDPEKRAALRRVVEDQARIELGDSYQLIKVEAAATLDGLEKELAVEERLQAMIDRCVKQLFHVKGLKSVISASRTASPLRIAGPRKAA